MYASHQVIVDTIGHELAKKLLAAFGGERTYWARPDNIGPENDIAKVIGVEAARRLAALWAQEYVELPLGSRQFLASVREAILRDREHLTVRELIRKYRPITRRSILRILAEGPAAEARQRSLL